jgi:hypothetical protein
MEIELGGPFEEKLFSVKLPFGQQSVLPAT